MEGNDDEKYFFNFSFFQIDPKWRWMADLAKEESAKEVENVIKNSGIKFRTYSTLGLRSDADFLFWFAGNESKKYAVVYPFTKTRAWYWLSKAGSQKMADERRDVTQRYPDIVLNT